MPTLFLGVQGEDSLHLSSSETDISPSKSTRDTRINRSARSILRHFGEIGIFNGYLPVKVVHRKDVERFSAQGEVVTVDHQLSFLRDSLPFVKKNDEIKIDAGTFYFQSPIDRSNEGLNIWIIN